MLLKGLRPAGDRARRAGVAALAAASVVVPAAVAVVAGHGFPTTDLALSGGGAWLASPSVGLVTLVDGPAERVAASVTVPIEADDRVEVSQAGPSAYVVNDTSGSVSRVDGALLEVSASVQFGERGGGVDVLAGGGQVHVLDVSRRTASVVEPASLRVLEEVSTAASPGQGQAVVDGSGRLWVVDSERGGLTWFDGAQGDAKGEAPDRAGPRDRVVLVQGEAVLVDLEAGRVGRLGDNGGVDDWSCLDVRADDDVTVAGSGSRDEVYALVPASGSLLRAGVGSDDCGAVVPVGSPGDAFGAIATSGGFAFVPNHATGTTYVVDVREDEVVGQFELADPGHRVELVPKDGLVFYNDLDSEHAGVLTLQGGRWVHGASVQKYDPADPDADVVAPDADAALPAPPAEGGGETQADDATTEGRLDDAAALPDDGDPPSQSRGAGGAPPPGRGSPPPVGGSRQGGAPGGPGPGRPAGPVVTDITAAPGVVRGAEVVFSAQVSNPEGEWVWTVADGAGHEHGGGSTPGTFTYQVPEVFEAGSTLLVRLKVGSSEELTRSFTVDARPLVVTTTRVDPSPAEALTTERVDLTVRVDPASGDGVPEGEVAVVFHVPAESPPEQSWGTFPLSGGQAAIEGRQFPDAGKVTAEVTYLPSDDVHSGSVGSAPVTVVDGCRLVADGPTQLDVRAARTVGTARVRLDRCSGTPAITWQRAPWLGNRGGGGAADLEHTVDQVSDPPNDGLNSGAVTASLGNGSPSVTFDVLGNSAPVWNNYAVCVMGTPDATFYADFEDAQVSTLTVSLTVGGTTRTMEYTNGGRAGHGEFHWLPWPTAELPDVGTWSVRATDAYGLVSGVGTGKRGQCW